MIFIALVFVIIISVSSFDVKHSFFSFRLGLIISSFQV